MPRRKVTIGRRDFALDARPDRLDLRDRPYAPRLHGLPTRWPSDEDARRWLPAYAAAGLVRDQGEDGACTGFGLAAVIDYLEFVATFDGGSAKRKRAVRRSSPAMLYELARLYDEWPGEDYEGSSCRGALKGWYRHGVCREDLWSYQLDAKGKRVFVRPTEDSKRRDDANRNWDVDALQCTIGVYYRIDARSVVDMQAAIRETGAIYCSGSAHEGWDIPSRKTLRGHDDLARIKYVASPKDDGGHAFALVGYNQEGFVLQNSWGRSWGSLGFALLPYEEWVAHGEDAWVFTLGVPSARTLATEKEEDRKKKPGVARSPSFFVPEPDQGQRDPAERPAGIVGASDAVDRKYRDVPAQLQPLDANAAYAYTIVLDRGFPVRNDITAKDAFEEIARAGYERPNAWLAENKSNKLMIYAHGGLNSEGDSIARIRALAPYALDSAIYPLFISWRSGPLETVSDLVEEFFAKLGFGVRGARPVTGWLDQITDKTDRLLEPVLRAPGGAMWQQMKLNAARASDNPEGGCRALVTQLARLAADRPKLEIHLVGHSAGSIVLGAMLDQLRQAGLKVASLRLLAPACTLEFALARYKPAVEAKVLDPKRWHIHNLSDKNEQDDNVGPYRKSLLYLVSRSFEDVHKTALLGLDRAFDPAVTQEQAEDDMFGKDEREIVRAWQSFWRSLKVDAENRAAHVYKDGHMPTGAGSIAASHGGFDNAIDVLGDTLGYIVNPGRPKRVRIYRLDY